jgi:hypothetical protein
MRNRGAGQVDSEPRRTPGLAVKPSNISLTPPSNRLDLHLVPPRQRPDRAQQRQRPPTRGADITPYQYGGLRIDETRRRPAARVACGRRRSKDTARHGYVAASGRSAGATSASASTSNGCSPAGAGRPAKGRWTNDTDGFVVAAQPGRPRGGHRNTGLTAPSPVAWPAHPAFSERPCPGRATLGRWPAGALSGAFSCPETGAPELSGGRDSWLVWRRATEVAGVEQWGRCGGGSRSGADRPLDVQSAYIEAARRGERATLIDFTEPLHPPLCASWQGDISALCGAASRPRRRRTAHGVGRC